MFEAAETEESDIQRFAKRNISLAVDDLKELADLVSRSELGSDEVEIIHQFENNIENIVNEFEFLMLMQGTINKSGGLNMRMLLGDTDDEKIKDRTFDQIKSSTKIPNIRKTIRTGTDNEIKMNMLNSGTNMTSIVRDSFINKILYEIKNYVSFLEALLGRKIGDNLRDIIMTLLNSIVEQIDIIKDDLISRGELAQTQSIKKKSYQ